MLVVGAKTRPGQSIHRFDNGYGASVISDGYGSEAGLFEVGVIKFREDDSWGLTYETPITNDVLGRLTPAMVADALRRIEALTERDIAAGQIARRQAEIDSLRAQIAALEMELERLEEEAR